MTFRTVIPVLLMLGSFGNPVQATPSTEIVIQCAESVEVVDNFNEYREQLYSCYYEQENH